MARRGLQTQAQRVPDRVNATLATLSADRGHITQYIATRTPLNGVISMTDSAPDADLTADPREHLSIAM